MSSLLSEQFQFLKEYWYKHQYIFDFAETEVVQMCFPSALMNTQYHCPSYSKVDLARGGKIKWVLPSQRPSSVGFLRNQPIVLEKFFWQVTTLSHLPENTFLPLSSVDLPVTTGPPWTIYYDHSRMLAPLNGSCWLQPSGDSSCDSSSEDKCPMILALLQDNLLGNGSYLGASWGKNVSYISGG